MLTPHASRKKVSRSLAFTISELLIALGIIGLIATFTVPKVLHSIDEASYRTALKQAESVIQTIGAEAYSQGYKGKRIDYYRDKVNAVKICTDPNGVTQGCMVVPVSVGASEYTENAFVLPSGVTIGGINGNSTFEDNGDVWLIDLNGVKSPNIQNVDILKWRPPSFNSSGQILDCNGRQLGCPYAGSELGRYRKIMGLP
jgi:type II secretory pathway pseudopilin PulG